MTAIPGIEVGHWTDDVARTGCTVVLLPEGTVASGAVGGGAPATREFELLAPERLVGHVDAVVLTGGSAFGLAAADGVMVHLAGRDRGFPTAAGPVPIVVAMGIFDLLEGDGAVRPTAANGRQAASTATAAEVPLGRVGVGSGCTIDKWRGRDHQRPGGLVGHAIRHGELVVAALVAVNAFGGVDEGGALIGRLPEPGQAFRAAPIGENTTVGVVATNAAIDKAGCHLVALGAHDGLARAVAPAHTRVDGDAFVACATGTLEDVPVDEVRFLAVAAVEAAIGSLRGGRA